jgi:hypothetical protein
MALNAQQQNKVKSVDIADFPQLYVYSRTTVWFIIDVHLYLKLLRYVPYPLSLRHEIEMLP